MPTKPHKKSKHPLYPSALTISDVQPGRRFVKINCNRGVVQEGVFTSTPYAGRSLQFTGLPLPTLEARIKTIEGELKAMLLEDAGIVPYSFAWNLLNFTIDPRKLHLFPAIERRESPQDNRYHLSNYQLSGW